MYQPYFQNKHQKKSFEDLSLALKRIKSGQEWESLLDYNTVIGLQEDFERYNYQHKLLQYKKELNNCDKLIGSFQQNANNSINNHIGGHLILFDFLFIGESLDALKERKSILQAIIKISEQYICTGNPTLKKHIDFLESSLHPYFTSQAFPSVYFVPNQVDQSSFFEFRNDFLAKRLRKRIGKLFLKICQDLRFRYRTIIKFLFKNMDDESGDNLIATNSNSIFLSSIKQSHGTNRYNTALSRAA